MMEKIWISPFMEKMFQTADMEDEIDALKQRIAELEFELEEAQEWKSSPEC